jgi:hypothetical protein
MIIKKGLIKNIIAHIKQCKNCCVNSDFDEFIYTRAGNSEAFLVAQKSKSKRRKIK